MTSDTQASYVGGMSLRHSMAAQLKSLRSRSGLSLAQVAAKVDMSRAGVNDLERAKSPGTTDTIEAVAVACHGWVALIIGSNEEQSRQKLAQLVERLEVTDEVALTRLLSAWERLSPVERDLLARMAEMRVEAAETAHQQSAKPSGRRA